MAARDDGSDFSNDSDDDAFDLDDMGTKKKRYAETPSDANDDFDFDSVNDEPSKPKKRAKKIVDSDDSDEDNAPKFVNWKMKEKQQRQKYNTNPDIEPEPQAVKRYDSDSDNDDDDDDDESHEDSRERSQYNNYYEYDPDLDDSDTKEPEPKSIAPVTPITPYETHKERRKAPQSNKQPLFSTYIEPLQDAPEPEAEEKQASKYDDDTYDNKPASKYDDDTYDNKPASKYDDNTQASNAYDNEAAPKYDDNKQSQASNTYDNEPVSKYDNKSSSKAMTVDEFQAVPLAPIFENDDSLRDHFDIGKKICKHFDDGLKDKNAVCVVSEPGKQPAISYWVNGDYVRKEKGVAGKDILLYRAISHKEATKPVVSSSEFQSFVNKISIDYESSSVDAICDMMDNKFGKGCHYARSKQEKPEFDIYARFSDKYDASFRLPSGAYVIAWRR